MSSRGGFYGISWGFLWVFYGFGFALLTALALKGQLANPRDLTKVAGPS